MTEPGIEILYIEGCPHWEPTLALVEHALVELGLELAVATTVVSSEAQALRVGFLGSPTLLVDGKDPFPSTAAPRGLACRVYSSDGRLAGHPNSAQVHAALAPLARQPGGALPR